MENKEAAPIIIDNGSCTIKAGQSGDDGPRVIFPTVIGRVIKSGNQGIEEEVKDKYLGDEINAKKSQLQLSSPIEFGIIKNWEDIEMLWKHCFTNQLKLDASEHPCLMTEAPMNPKSNKEKMTQILFEQFNVPTFYIAVSTVLTLYASGRTTGLIMDSGYGMTHTIPIQEGYVISHAMQKIKLGGKDLNQYLASLLKSELQMQGSKYTQNYIDQVVGNEDIMKDIKEKLCYISLNFEEEKKEILNNIQKQKQFELPDGQSIIIQDAQIQCPEALFNPSLLNKQIYGLQDLIYKSIQLCDNDTRKELWQNIVLSGGSTFFQNIDERIKKELEKIQDQVKSNSLKIKTMAPPERKHSVWIGGSILSTLSTFQTMWITKSEYQESGPTIVHRKCF